MLSSAHKLLAATLRTISFVGPEYEGSAISLQIALFWTHTEKPDPVENAIKVILRHISYTN